MLALGIEGTAHTLGIGIVDEKCRILANESFMYRPGSGGIHPRESANAMAEHFDEVMERALAASKTRVREVDCIAYSRGPGLGPCLRTAATAARALALAARKPLVDVNHCVAHLEIGRAVCRGCDDPALLYVSGGNSQVIAHKAGRYRVLGETNDIGLGNMLDKLGRELGIPFPAGPQIERRAREGEELLELPYSVKGMDLAFSGIMTAALTLARGGARVEDVLFSVQETCFAMLCEVAERALAHLDRDELLLGGGVVQNRRLKEMAGTMCRERGARMYCPPAPLCRDNGAMIAWLGLEAFRCGHAVPVARSGVDQRWRTDEVEAVWRERDPGPRERRAVR
jgi:N6-L-threonylcarbamoyladenine synthase/N6-L-threonylcarbamoyladenine synthase/protein kinase Bud32